MKRTVVFVLTGIVLAAGIFYVLKPGKGDEEISPANIPQEIVDPNLKIFSLTIENGKVVGENILKVTEGQNVVVAAISDAEEEIHFHGYDKILVLEKGIKNEISFIADKTGRFEFELEKSGIVLGVLEVFPR